MSIIGWCFGCQREVPWHQLAAHKPGHMKQRHYGGGQWVSSLCRGPVWPGVRVRGQDEAARLIPELLQVKAPGHWVEWVPGRRRLDLVNDEMVGADWNWLTGENYEWSDGTPGPRPDRNPIRWLRIVADPVGLCVDIAAVRVVVRDARAAGVPVWIEALGPHVVNSSNKIGPWPIVNDSDADTEMDMTDFADWPRDLQCRELPEVSP